MTVEADPSRLFHPRVCVQPHLVPRRHRSVTCPFGSVAAAVLWCEPLRFSRAVVGASAVATASSRDSSFQVLQLERKERQDLDGMD